jgi:hypothetical protein
VRDRALIPADRSLDIRYHELAGNEMTILQTLYEYNGTDLSPDVKASLQDYLDENPRGKHGRMVYDLKRDFDRSPDELRSRFAFYLERFGVREEG